MKTPKTCIRIKADEVQIKSCKEKIKSSGDAFAHLSSILALAGNEVRLKMMFLLDVENELCPCDLADILEMSIPAVSQHLRKMKDGNLVETRRDGQTIYYSLKAENLPLILPFFKHISDKTLKTELA